MIRSLPPFSSFTPSLKLPLPRSLSSIRETARAFWPRSVESRLNRSISSMTSMGMRTWLSSKFRMELGS
jgi:hypothetical protein